MGVLKRREPVLGPRQRRRFRERAAEAHDFVVCARDNVRDENMALFPHLPLFEFHISQKVFGMAYTARISRFVARALAASQRRVS